MIHNAFTIEFICTNCFNNEKDESGYYRYNALITVISRSFRLFHVDQIKRIKSGSTILLRDSYYLTSYPYPVHQKYTWKDAVTFDSNNFLEVIGKTIDAYLSDCSYAESICESAALM